jgi:butyrate kinase
MNLKILVINTGAASTKVGLFHSTRPVFVGSIQHPEEELAKFKNINAQKDFREKIILDFLAENEVDIGSLAAVAARGGWLRPLEGGTYLVNDKMLTDLIEGKRGFHACHLSAQIGHSIAQKAGISCYVVDPLSMDEYEPIARYTGHKLFQRECLAHALNMKAIAKRYAKDNHLNYNKITVITVHLGTGISIAIHKKGKMVDAVNSREEGTFSGDRCGGLPVLRAARYVIENKLDFETFSDMVFGNGGLISYLGTKDFRKITEMYENGNREAVDVVNAVAYQVAKDVGALATVNYGKINAIIFSGGMAHENYFVALIKERVQFIAPVVLYPGGDEMEALAEGIQRILLKEEKIKTY